MIIGAANLADCRYAPWFFRPRALLHVIASTVLLCAGLQVSSSSAADPPTVTRLTRDGRFKQRPVWSPDGKSLLFSQHTGDKILLLQWTGENAPVQRLMPKITLPQYDAVWSADGKRLSWTKVEKTPGQGNLDLWTSLADGSEPRLLAGDKAGLSHEEWASWSPDGKRLVFTSTFEKNQELYVVDANGENRQRLTNDPAFDVHPHWSPDGKRIVFATSRWGDFELAIVDVDSLNVTRLTTSRGLDDYPVWSPDGTRIAFTSNRDGNFEIYVMQADGTQPQNITQHPGADNFPAWSPDGKLVFVSNREGSFDLYQTATPVSMP